MAVVGLACPRDTGHVWPAPSGASHHVRLHVLLLEPGQNEFVFVHHHLAGPRAPKHQLTRGPARPRQLLYAAYGRARSFPAS